jgi:HAMP domain-containing protein
METPKQSTPNQPLLARLADKLLEAQQELDELALQFTLGKAEAKDKFEELKITFARQLQVVKAALNQAEVQTMANRLKTRVEDLELQLALGKSETKEIFEAQRKKILEALVRLENDLKQSLPASINLEELYHEIEKFKLKLEIIRLKFILKKFMVKDSFREKMKDARRNVSRLTDQASSKWKAGSEKLTDFKDEIQLAYKHLRKAIESF